MFTFFLYKTFQQASIDNFVWLMKINRQAKNIVNVKIKLFRAINASQGKTLDTRKEIIFSFNFNDNMSPINMSGTEYGPDNRLRNISVA